MAAASPSAEVIGNNDDLITQVLIAIPPQSLLTLRFVSKQWNNVIFNPEFRFLRLHLGRRRPHRPSFLLRLSNDPHFYVFDPAARNLVPFHFGLPHVTVLQSCNGLFLLRSRDSHGDRFYVFNPFTGRRRDLYIERAFVGICLAFDPLKSPHNKVYCFRICRFKKRAMSVYDSETRVWTHRNEPDLDIGTFNEGVYWVDGFYHIKSNCMYRRFSLEDERTYEIPRAPKLTYPGHKRYYTVESNGHMHSLSLSLRPNRNCLFVHELSHGDYQWFQIHRVDLEPISAAFAANNGTAITVLGMVRADRLEDSFVLFHVPGQIMIYRFLTRTFDEEPVELPWMVEEGHLDFGFEDAHQFVFCIAPV